MNKLMQVAMAVAVAMMLPTSAIAQETALPAPVVEQVPSESTSDEQELYVVDGKHCTPVLDKLFGASRHETLTNTMRWIYQSHSSQPYTIMARDDDYHDVLAMIPYAVRARIPVVVTSKHRVNPHTMRYLNRYRRGTQIFVVGGHNAVSPSVDKELRHNGYQVQRLAGVNRAETMELIARGAVGMDRGIIRHHRIMPQEVIGGALHRFTPVVRDGQQMPYVYANMCYRSGDEVAALYLQAFKKVEEL